MNNDDITNTVLTRKAKCGHQDMLGYFAGTTCRKCADKGHRKVTGKTTTPQGRK